MSVTGFYTEDEPELHSSTTTSFLIKNILTKGSVSGTNPKTADTSNSWGEGTGQAEASEAAEAIDAKKKRWESGNG